MRAFGPLGAEGKEERKVPSDPCHLFAASAPSPSSVVSGTLSTGFTRAIWSAIHMSAEAPASVLTQGPAGCQRLPAEGLGATACSLVSPAGKCGEGG